MTNWCTLARKLALSRGRVIDPQRAQIIKDELLADGKIDEEEFAFLMALRGNARWVDAQLDDLIFQAAKPVLLKAGSIAPQDARWLESTLTSAGQVNEQEKQFLQELLAASDKHCGEFVAWCAGLGLAPTKTVVGPAAGPPREMPAATAQMESEVQRLIQATEGEVRWLRWAVIGLVCMMVLLGGASAGVFVFDWWPGGEPGLAPLKRGKTARQKSPPEEEHKIVKATINGVQTRGLDILEDTATSAVFSKSLKIDLRRDWNEVILVEKNDFATPRTVQLWITLTTRGQGTAPLPDCHITADVNGQKIDFGKVKAVDGIARTKAEPVTLKAGMITQNPITLEVQNPTKNTVPVVLEINWQDDPKAVSLYVLGVGVSKYKKHPAERSLDLRYAHKDAEALVEVLKNQKGSLFDEVYPKLLMDKEATRDAILKELKHIQGKAREHDLVFLVFAGHGETHATDGGFCFLPHDFDPELELESTAMPWSYFETYLGKMQCRVVVVMDACHSGAIKLGPGLRGEIGGASRKREVEEALQGFANTGQKRGVVVISACTDKQMAREKDEWGHGALTKFLLDGLHQTDGGIVFLDSLEYAAQKGMRELVPGQAVVVESSGNLSMAHIPIALALPKKRE